MTFPDRHLLLAYSDAIAANLKAGNATEHTHRPALKTLLEGMGAPDYILTCGTLPLGYDDITHYQHTLAALARTLAIQAELDAAVHAAGGWPLQ